MSNNLWVSPNEIKNHMTTFGTSGFSFVAKEKAMADKKTLTTKYLLAQALQDFDKSDIQNIIDNVKCRTFSSFKTSRFPTTSYCAFYITKSNGFLAIIENLGLLLDFNLELKPKRSNKGKKLLTSIQNIFKKRPTKDNNPRYDCYVNVNVLDPLKNIVNLSDFESYTTNLIRDVLYHYLNLYNHHCGMNVDYIYQFKKARNSDFSLFNACANGDENADEHLPSFFVIVKGETTIIKNYLPKEQRMAIDIVNEWSKYINHNDKYDNYPISKHLNDTSLKYVLDLSIKKYVGLPISVCSSKSNSDDTIIHFYNLDAPFEILAIPRIFPTNSNQLYGYQYYNEAKASANELVENEIIRFKNDYEQYIKEFADFINVFKTGAQNLENDLWDTHLRLRADLKTKLEDFDHKSSTINVI